MVGRNNIIFQGETCTDTKNMRSNHVRNQWFGHTSVAGTGEECQAQTPEFT